MNTFLLYCLVRILCFGSASFRIIDADPDPAIYLNAAPGPGLLSDPGFPKHVRLKSKIFLTFFQIFSSSNKIIYEKFGIRIISNKC
jgi:hypothetical protein